eukprot:CAMPEP_0201476582 /NCGR_PEP_ID=MMETSP0151_2-20130828/1769_1 /ASSEMBLY_ACC=CAM_ASM_000257 /TAXON_ID=200890 /ORGANISM="Paramoeba atlantica, Strain 621/1 / CCAP 1560/9" /LENGTH=237 /DNA_ID=CAMNT_0047856997 /DNA_START=128 /DNA_END=841 /DNA_ORIENTATION=-
MGESQNNGKLSLGKEKGFKELSLIEDDCYDINLSHHLNQEYHYLDYRPMTTGSIFMGDVFQYIKEHSSSLLSSLFEGDFIHVKQGIQVALPNASSQRWHVEVPPLFAVDTMSNTNVPIPVYYVSVCVPLFEASSTEFAIGSQHLTYSLGRKSVEDLYPNEHQSNAIIQRSGGKALLGENPGDILIMDGRTLHRPLSNKTSSLLPLVYMGFCRPWYRPWPLSLPERSLFETVDVYPSS